MEGGISKAGLYSPQGFKHMEFFITPQKTRQQQPDSIPRVYSIGTYQQWLEHPGRLTAGSPTAKSPMKRKENDLNQTSREICEPAVDFFRGGVDFEAPTYHEIQLCLNRFSASLRILAEEDALDAWYWDGPSETMDLRWTQV